MTTVDRNAGGCPETATFAFDGIRTTVTSLQSAFGTETETLWLVPCITSVLEGFSDRGVGVGRPKRYLAYTAVTPCWFAQSGAGSLAVRQVPSPLLNSTGTLPQSQPGQ